MFSAQRTVKGARSRGSRSASQQPPRLPPSEVSVTLSPGTVELAPGQTQIFTAFVTGADNQSVTWQVEGGEIDVSGASGDLYRARNDGHVHPHGDQRR